MQPSYQTLLSGGHPNSLGNTLQVVNEVLANQNNLQKLYNTYFSKDEVVRLRVSNAFKQVCLVQPSWVYKFCDNLINQIFPLNQASVQWTMPILFRLMSDLLTKSQQDLATSHFKHNLQNHTDWIVINTTMETLFEWSKTNKDLATWLKPVLETYMLDTHKSIASRAKKYLKVLG
jgi:hypothetical protein